MSKSLKQIIDKYDDTLLSHIDVNKLKMYPDEEFKILETYLYPEILPKYLISNKNRIFDCEEYRFIPIRINGANYHQVTLQTDDSYSNNEGKRKRVYLLHRLMMSVFFPVDNMESLFINHKDGIRANNELSNLEWCTASENIRHAYDTGLAHGLSSENSPYATITNEQARKICELHTTGIYTYSEIANIIGTTKSVVNNIVSGDSWRDAVGDYDFSKRELRKPSKKFTIEELHMICKYFEENPRMKDESMNKYMIRTIVDTDLKSGKYDELLIASLCGIYKRMSYKIIGSKYNF